MMATPIDESLVYLLVWISLGGIACIASIVALLIAWLGRPSGMLVGGVVLGIGLAMFVGVSFVMPRYWFVAIVPTAVGAQTLRQWSKHGQQNPGRWTFQLNTFVMMVIAGSIFFGGVVAIRRQRTTEQAIIRKIEAGGGYVLESFDGIADTVLLRNLSRSTINELAPLASQLKGIRELGLEGSQCSEAAVESLTVLRRLRELSFQNAQFDPGAGAHIPRFSTVVVLDLIKAQGLSEQELLQLSTLQRLKRLYLPSSASPQVLQQLRQALPEAEIDR